MANEPINDGGPAFPSRVKADVRLVQHLRSSANVSLQEAAAALENHPGMSLRAWLAGQALAGLCANPACVFWVNERLSEAATKVADAVIVELSKKD